MLRRRRRRGDVGAAGSDGAKGLGRSGKSRERRSVRARGCFGDLIASEWVEMWKMHCFTRTRHSFLKIGRQSAFPHLSSAKFPATLSRTRSIEEKGSWSDRIGYPLDQLDGFEEKGKLETGICDSGSKSFG
ncbi:hypothetical protein AKJ16_DCAP22415 [Drosera capensis]